MMCRMQSMFFSLSCSCDGRKPTLGSIFFVWYKDYFTKIFIDNSNTTSNVVKSANEYICTHVVKEKKNAASD